MKAGSGQDAINAVETLLNQGATALVIDLRGNAGGLAAETRTAAGRASQKTASDSGNINRDRLYGDPCQPVDKAVGDV